jgi:hypothetical protein
MVSLLQGLQVIGAGVAIAGALSSASAQEDAADAAASQSTKNSGDVLALAEKNVLQVEANIDTIRQAEVFNRAELLNTGSETRIKSEFNRRELRLRGEQAIETGGQKRAEISRALQKAVSTARATGGAAGITSNFGSVQQVITSLGIDAGLNTNAVDINVRQELERLEQSDQQNTFSTEIALLQIERDLIILDYNTEVSVDREERRIEILRLQAQAQGANFANDALRQTAAGDAAFTAGLFNAGSAGLRGAIAYNS